MNRRGSSRHGVRCKFMHSELSEKLLERLKRNKKRLDPFLSASRVCIQMTCWAWRTKPKSYGALTHTFKLVPNSAQFVIFGGPKQFIVDRIGSGGPTTNGCRSTRSQSIDWRLARLNSAVFTAFIRA